MKNTRGFKNMLILIIAPLLALILFSLSQNMKGLTASVLDIGEIQKIKQEGWDIAYKTNAQIFELFGSDTLIAKKELSIELLYNPEKVDVLIDQATGTDLDIIKATSGSMKLHVMLPSDFSPEKGFLSIPFSGDDSQILLAGAFSDQGKQNLKIGNLNMDNEHSILP